MILVNLYGAPDSGKSIGAAYIFSKLKMAGADTQLVHVKYKDKTMIYSYSDTQSVHNNFIL